MTRRPTADEAAAIGLVKAVPPEQKRYPQCRNCKSYTYDADDYMNLRGQLALRKSNPRCTRHNIAVLKSSVCPAHEFAHKDRSDR